MTTEATLERQADTMLGSTDEVEAIRDCLDKLANIDERRSALNEERKRALDQLVHDCPGANLDAVLIAHRVRKSNLSESDKQLALLGIGRMCQQIGDVWTQLELDV